MAPEAPAPAQKTSALAIWSLVLNGLGLFSYGILSIPGIICSIVALTRIRRSGGQLRGRGLAIADIVISGLGLLLLIWLGLEDLSHLC